MRNMFFRSYHGVLEQEKTEGNTFRVNVSIHTPTPDTIPPDDISTVIDYREVHAIVAKEMEIPSDLLEHVVWRIHHALTLAFPQAEEIHVMVAKKRPKLPGLVEWASVEI